MSFLKRYRHLWPWAAVISLGALVRLKLAFQLGTPWFDEAFTWRFAQRPVGEILRLMRLDVHPPLHMLAVHFWMMAFGNGAFVMRALSVITALVGLVVFTALARGLIGKKPAFLALFLAALSPIMVYYGADARMYAAVFTLSCLSSWLFWRVVHGEEGMRRYWFWASLALVLTHITGAFVIIAQAAFLIRSAERRPLFKKLFIDFFLMAAVLCVWLIPAAAARFGSLSGEWQFRNYPDAPSPFTVLVYWLWVTNDKAQLAIIFFFAALCLLAAVMRRSERRPFFRMTEEGEFLFWWLGCAFAPFFFLSAASPRYLTAAVAPFFLLLAKGFMNAGGGKRSTLLLGMLVVAFFSFTGLAVQLSMRAYNWDHVVDWISERYQPGDRVVFGWFADRLAFDAAAAPPFSRDTTKFDMRGLYPFDDDYSEDERYVAHAGTLALKNADLDRLGPLFDGAKRVFYIPNNDAQILDGGSYPDDVNAWFASHGWFLGDRKDEEGRIQGVWLMVKK